MTSIDYDLRYLQAGVEDLQAYLLSDVLYWPVSVSAPHKEPAYPPVTLGNLLLSRARLQGRLLPEDSQKQLSEAVEKMDACRQRWRSAWGRKAARSFHARLTQWQSFLSEHRGRPAEHAGRYPYEVRLRVLLALLKPELEGDNARELSLLAAIDSQLERVFIPGSFIWEAELEPSFPKGAYWFLYGELRK